jgi:hypothetical protein
VLKVGAFKQKYGSFAIKKNKTYWLGLLGCSFDQPSFFLDII